MLSVLFHQFHEVVAWTSPGVWMKTFLGITLDVLHHHGAPLTASRPKEIPWPSTAIHTVPVTHKTSSCLTGVLVSWTLLDTLCPILDM